MTTTPEPAAIIILDEPIEYGLDPIKELRIRRPTARDILRHGIPVKVISYDPIEIDFDQIKAFKMLAALTNLPVEGTLENMSSNDTVSALYAIAPFFIPGYSMRAAASSPEEPSKPTEP